MLRSVPSDAVMLSLSASIMDKMVLPRLTGYQGCSGPQCWSWFVFFVSEAKQSRHGLLYIRHILTVAMQNSLIKWALSASPFYSSEYGVIKFWCPYVWKAMIWDSTTFFTLHYRENRLLPVPNRSTLRLRKNLGRCWQATLRMSKTGQSRFLS